MSVTPDEGRTHWHGCEQERGHHACALAELARLRAELDAIGAVVGWSRERCEQDGDSPLDCAIMMRADLDRARIERDICAERYDSLLFAVGTKRPGESRHETALRYIQQAEQRTSEPGQASALAQEPPA